MKMSCDWQNGRQLHIIRVCFQWSPVQMICCRLRQNRVSQPGIDGQEHVRRCIGASQAHSPIEVPVLGKSEVAERAAEWVGTFQRPPKWRCRSYDDRRRMS